MGTAAPRQPEIELHPDSTLNTSRPTPSLGSELHRAADCDTVPGGTRGSQAVPPAGSAAKATCLARRLSSPQLPRPAPHCLQRNRALIFQKGQDDDARISAGRAAEVAHIERPVIIRRVAKAEQDPCHGWCAARRLGSSHGGTRSGQSRGNGPSRLTREREIRAEGQARRLAGAGRTKESRRSVTRDRLLRGTHKL
jgi:hypothetical protein